MILRLHIGNVCELILTPSLSKYQVQVLITRDPITMIYVLYNASFLLCKSFHFIGKKKKRNKIWGSSSSYFA